MGWDTAMLKTEFLFEKWQMCFSGTIQILESREKNIKLGTEKKETLIKNNNKKEMENRLQSDLCYIHFSKELLKRSRTLFVTLIPRLSELPARQILKWYIKNKQWKQMEITGDIRDTEESKSWISELASWLPW